MSSAGRSSGPTAGEALAATLATDRARIMGAVIASVVDCQVAEDVVQDACERAVTAWERDGVPANPAGWIVTTARRRAIDLHRRAVVRRSTAQAYAVAVGRGLLDGDGDGAAADPAQRSGRAGPDEIEDDRLRLICTCAHPALSLESRVALTLRTVLGTPVADIADLFLTTPAAVSKRLVRARARIAHAGIPYRVPPRAELPERVDGVLGVVYLVFTSGYAMAGSRVGADAMDEALRLVRLLRKLVGVPERLEVDGLGALMLLQRSRRAARFAADGTPVALADQDRSTWDRAAVEEARTLLAGVTTRAAHGGLAVGRYTLEAAIALEHALPETPEATDWVRIARLHELLARVAGSPAQHLALAVATGRARGPEHGLALLEDVADDERTHLHHAARADLLERAGRVAEARDAYRRAAGLAPSPERTTALLARAARLTDV